MKIKSVSMFAFALLFVSLAQAETVRVMSFNMWGQNCAQQIQSSGADIIGVQEAGNEAFFNEIADQLGFYRDYGTYTLSRWPITAVQGYGFGNAVTIRTPTGQTVYMFNIHTQAYPYAPYALPDTKLALRQESQTQWPSVKTALSNMASYITTGKPLFFTGDFNCPSHLDYSNVAWKCSTECANSGLTDSYWHVNGPPGGHLWPSDWLYNDSGITWTPMPEREPYGKFDRIDFVYYAGTGVNSIASSTTNNGPSDHRPVLSTFTIPDGPGITSSTLTTDKSAYASGDSITVTFDNGPGNVTDWIGIYASGDTPGGSNSLCWCYLNGTQTPPSTGVIDGSVIFKHPKAVPVCPLPAGNYEVYFLCCDGYDILAGPLAITVN